MKKELEEEEKRESERKSIEYEEFKQSNSPKKDIFSEDKYEDELIKE